MKAVNLMPSNMVQSYQNNRSNIAAESPTLIKELAVQGFQWTVLGPLGFECKDGKENAEALQNKHNKHGTVDRTALQRLSGKLAKNGYLCPPIRTKKRQVFVVLVSSCLPRL